MWQRNPASDPAAATPFFECSSKPEDPEDGTAACGTSRFKIKKFPDGVVAECEACGEQYPLKDIVNAS